MFDVDNLLNSPLIPDPWRHQIISEFFNKEDFRIVSEGMNKLLATLDKDTTYEDSTGITILEAKDIIGEECFNIILASNEILLDNISKITEKYPNHHSYSSFYSLPKFHILKPNCTIGLHDEAIEKTCSIVVYLSPEDNVGTALHTANSAESFVKEIPWQVNNAMLFCGEQNVTWHNFYSNHNQRVTLNYFIQYNFMNSMETTDTSYILTSLTGKKMTIPKSEKTDQIAKYISMGYLVR